MSKHLFSWDSFYRVPIVGIIRGLTPVQVKNILPVYVVPRMRTLFEPAGSE